MSIAPVEGFPPSGSGQSGSGTSANAKVRSDSAPARLKSNEAEEAAQPVSETLPKEESSIAKNVPAPHELPEDVVEVHQDPEIKSQIIIQYLDSAKNVIMPVPSAQELSVERGIVRESQQAAKLRASEAAAAAESERGKTTHGH